MTLREYLKRKSDMNRNFVMYLLTKFAVNCILIIVMRRLNNLNPKCNYCGNELQELDENHFWCANDNKNECSLDGWDRVIPKHWIDVEDEKETENNSN